MGTCSVLMEGKELLLPNQLNECLIISCSLKMTILRHPMLLGRDFWSDNILPFSSTTLPTNATTFLELSMMAKLGLLKVLKADDQN